MHVSHNKGLRTRKKGLTLAAELIRKFYLSLFYFFFFLGNEKVEHNVIFPFWKEQR